MTELERFTLTFASTSDSSVRKTENVQAVSMDIAANDAIEEPDADWFLIRIEQTEFANTNGA